MPFETPKNFQPYTASEEEIKNLRPLTKGEADELGIGGKKSEKKSAPEKSDPFLAASFRNPETAKEKEISFDIEKEFAFFEGFYQKNLGLDLDRSEIISIWEQNYQEMRQEIETYGYDTLLIVPASLPEEEILNQKLIETMEENVGGKKQKVASTYQGDSFKEGGAFAGVRNPEQPRYRIILTHAEQNMYDNPNANPFLKATLGKSIMALSGLDAADIQARIAGNLEIPVSFEANIGSHKKQIKAEGFSWTEYAVFQRVFFEKTGKHLDENGYTRFPKSYSGSLVVGSDWDPDGRRLNVLALDPGLARGGLGSRLSRSFKKLP
ncbi:MAG: hypothetical protein AAB547_02990 [Patescibacteria group bacterium]